ncbi:MAG: ABC transporter permease [Propionibacteriaceae bacterium]|jgi:putative ABC transport system permease protein|nr:ABC transporter permease [Propionibacteriaceae bacterium]
MLTLANAFKSISRSLGRSLLLGVIVAVIAAAACVALAIRGAAASAQADALASIKITGVINRDVQKLMTAVQGSTAEGTEPSRPDATALAQVMAEYPDLGLGQLQTYAESSHVADFNYSASASLDTAGEIEPYSSSSSEEEETDETTTGGWGGLPGGGSMPGGQGGFSTGDVTVLGASAESALTGFISGSQRITTGSMIDLTAADDACLVSNQFALFNALATGDEIDLANPQDEAETHSCQISGLYDVDATAADQRRLSGLTALDPANQIYVSYPTLAAWADASAAAATVSDDGQSTALSLQLSATYVFSSPDDYSAFEAELRAQGLSDYYTLSSTDLNSYEASAVPLKNLSSFATTLLWLVLGVGGAILIAVSVFTVRERKYEVGVYTAIGLPKVQVALQFATEVLAVTMAGVVVGLGAGAAAAPSVANNLLSAQVTQAEADSSAQDQNFGRLPMSSGGPGNMNMDRAGFGSQAVSYIDQVNAAVDLEVAGWLAAAGLGLAVAASFAGVVVVMRYEPLTILANRT